MQILKCRFKNYIMLHYVGMDTNLLLLEMYLAATVSLDIFFMLW